jgi:hypothetical protein
VSHQQGIVKRDGRKGSMVNVIVESSVLDGNDQHCMMQL